MERVLGLMAGAGVLPGRAAAEAKRHGWRVAAFAFDEAPGLAEVADDFVPSRITDIQSVLQGLAARQVSAAVFVGKFAKERVFSDVERTDVAGRRMARLGLSDAALGEMVVAALKGIGVEVLDQREFLSPWLIATGRLTRRAPSAEETDEIRAGFALARHLATFGVGQTVVRSRGVTVAVEAAEGTDETIRRGSRLAGPGTVVIKAVAAAHDYRFDVPTIGSSTLEAMVAGGATALAVDSGKLLLVDRDEVVRMADAAGIAVVSVDAQG
ncbi:MAG TPA: UDP-2,3-diacylglucosamine diphosphatase LpxI [Methylomirabilota bacterium]|nr:UDP-2,3-diacylglucosamine diphosphatase LpxI [Methylomirabilota bacterium]